MEIGSGGGASLVTDLPASSFPSTCRRLPEAGELRASTMRPRQRAHAQSWPDLRRCPRGGWPHADAARRAFRRSSVLSQQARAGQRQRHHLDSGDRRCGHGLQDRDTSLAPVRPRQRALAARHARCPVRRVTWWAGLFCPALWVRLTQRMPWRAWAPRRPPKAVWVGRVRRLLPPLGHVDLNGGSHHERED